MKRALLKIQHFLLSNNIEVAITFFFSGLLSGALLTWLIGFPAIGDFILFKPDADLKTQFIGFLLFTLFLILPLIIGVFVSSVRNHFIQKRKLTFARCFLARGIIGGALPLILLLTKIFPFVEGNIYLILSAFALLFALAMCIVTRSIRLLPIAFLVCGTCLTVAASTTALLSPLVEAGSHKGHFFYLAPFFASLSLCFGLWLRWRKERES